MPVAAETASAAVQPLLAAFPETQPVENHPYVKKTQFDPAKPSFAKPHSPIVVPVE
jgi:hypothetical protein